MKKKLRCTNPLQTLNALTFIEIVEDLQLFDQYSRAMQHNEMDDLSSFLANHGISVRYQRDKGYYSVCFKPERAAKRGFIVLTPDGLPALRQAYGEFDFYPGDRQ